MFKFRFDLWLFIPALLLSLLGLLVIRSVAPDLFVTQLTFFAIGIILFVLFASLDYQLLFSLHFPIYIFSVIMLVLPYLFGIYSRGAVRWLQIGSSRIQPSEVIKPFMLITFASLALAKDHLKFLYLFFAGVVPLLLIFLQPDLGTTLVLATGWGMIILYHLPLRKILPLLIIVPLLAIPLYRYGLHDYQRQRLITFINPYADPLGQGYHVIQSTIAVGSGGLFGRGLGQGTQSQLRFLPEHHTDFIFAALSEELGFVGAVFVIILYLILLYRIYRISQTTQNIAASLMCIAAAALLAFQILVNIGMNIGIAPITGITLPFLSYGGSSLVSLAILLGILSSISTANHNYSYLQIGD